MSVYKKLMQARLRLQGEKLSKSGHNKFAGYYYFELGDFLPTVQNIFSEVGLCGIVSFQADIATLRIVDMEDAGEIVITSPMGSAALKGVHEVQNIGAVETYQRRYLWVTAMEIVEHDALDALVAQDDPKPQKAQAKPAQKPVVSKDQTKPSVLSDNEMADALVALREADDLEVLKTIFANAYRKASAQQQTELKAVYDKLKTKLSEGA